MQGTAADIIKKAMIAVDGWIQNPLPQGERGLIHPTPAIGAGGGGSPIKMIMQVHDELVFEIADDTIETAIPQIRDLMGKAAVLDVPLSVDIGVGMNWDEAH